MKFALSAVLLIAATPLFHSATESKWSVHKGSAQIGTVTLLTSASGTARAEFRPTKGAVTTFLGDSKGTVWQRTGSGDVEVKNAETPEAIAASALLFKGDAKVSSDAKGPSKIEADKYTLTRTSLSSSNADAATFAVRPKKGASSRLAALSGDLLGSSNSNVAATAGGRGAGEKGLKLKDGGDYSAVEKLENRDAKWKQKLDGALEEFQKDGKVGKARENQ